MSKKLYQDTIGIKLSFLCVSRQERLVVSHNRGKLSRTEVRAPTMLTDSM